MKVVAIMIGMTLLLATPVWADVNEGTSTSTVDIQTDTGGGSGSVNTHVETNVNGHVQNFDSTQPGSYHIENNGTTSSVTNTDTGQTMSGDPSPATQTATSSASPTPTIKPIQHVKTTDSLWSMIANFFKSLFHIS